MHATTLDMFQLLLLIKTNLLEYLIGHKGLMIFHNDAPDSHAPAFLEFLANGPSTMSHSKSANHTCKSHTISPENSLCLLLK